MKLRLFQCCFLLALINFFNSSKILSQDVLSYSISNNEETGITNVIHNIPVVDCSVLGGFFEKPFQVELKTVVDAAIIKYTLNGSIPSAENGIIYKEPISISSTTILKVCLVANNLLSSPVLTHTYIFPSKVITQPQKPQYADGMFFPSTWSGYPADYEMDEKAISHEGEENVMSALISIPTLSLVMNDSDLFQKIMNEGDKGENSDLDQAVSMEMLFPNEPRANFQINCGIRPRSRSLGDRAAKRGFLLSFTSEFGPSKLDYPIFIGAPTSIKSMISCFDKLVLRPGFCDSWSSAGYDDYQDTYTRDAFARESFMEVSGNGTNNHFVHLYLNGLYWGIYNLTEKIDERFASDKYGGNYEDWLVVKSETDSDSDGLLKYGSDERYQHLLDLVGGNSHGQFKSLENDADYQKVVKLIEPISFAEYIMTHCYCGAGDWPDNNWYFLMCNNPEKPGFFQMWDAEKSLAAYGNDGRPHAWYSPLLTEYDSRGGRAVPSRIWKAMISNPDFRMTFADVVYANLFNNGPLTNEKAKERWLSLNNFLGYSNKDSAAIIGEAARWGDLNSNLKNPPASYSVWHKAVSDVANALAKNVEIFTNEFSEVLPELNPPVLLNDNENITNSTLPFNSSILLKMINPNNEGDIYFSIDGIDPRIFGGADRNLINSSTQKYKNGFPVKLMHVIKARVYYNGKWSALSEVKLNSNLKMAITELMYNPPSVNSLQSDDKEFIEIKNVGAETVNLRNCKFEEGIFYEFKADCILDPDQFIVLASNLNVFKKIYPSANVFDEYSGNLSNSGEKIVLTDQVGNKLVEVSYDDDLPWPVVADGSGFSLVPKINNPYGDQSNWENWRACCSFGGSPGYDDPECLYSMKVRINEILTNPASGSSERIELYNEDVNSIDISGWYISSDKSQPYQFNIPANTLLKGESYVVFDKQDLIENEIIKKENLFNASGGEIYLFETNKDGKLTGFSNGQYYGPQIPGVSFGSYEISTGEKHFVAQDVNTFGMENSYPLVGPIVISKLMYHDFDSENEFIYLNNISQNVVCLYDELNPDYTWEIGGLGFIFPPYVKISPQSYLVLTNQNPEEFRIRGSIPSEIDVFQFQGRLSNSGESLKLLKPVRTLNKNGLIETQFIQIDRIDYDDNAPWPTEADGSGYFLQREELEGYGNDPGNWTSWLYSQILTKVNQIVNTTALDVAIYPNPANNYLIIHFNHEIQKDYIIEIRNQSGLLMYKQHIGSSEQNEIRMEPLYLQSGIYYAIVRGNNYLKVEKLIFL